jgi:mRNA interferase RelE/StbE
MARRSSAARYRVELTPAAARQFRKLSPEVRRRLKVKIDALAVEPRPAGVEKLAGEDGFYRVRAGDYRIVYSVDDGVLLVLLVTIGHRADVYKALRRR